RGAAHRIPASCFAKGGRVRVPSATVVAAARHLGIEHQVAPETGEVVLGLHDAQLLNATFRWSGRAVTFYLGGDALMDQASGMSSLPVARDTIVHHDLNVVPT